ncbi:MAG TPA: Gfo/Idh/MocA family oxidoreductase [Verrucomicrobiae bacterium]|jgi:predicted dehydrogenase|nr:Gfo/Idh/MocA family oxidoreductase [Verrucomicrobiae bacterium]
MKPKSFSISRRSFLKRVSLAGAAAGLPAWFIERDLAQAAPTRILGPNDRPAIALVGCGGQGRADASLAKRHGDIVAVCDVDSKHAEAAAAQFAEGGKKPVIFDDFRKVMERDDIQIILTTTPDHWHTLVNVAAAKAGKDVYAEKPLTLTVDEGHHVINAVRKSKIVLQTGTQQRSSARFRLACELVRNERIGQLKQITVWLPAGLREGPFAAKPTPSELNWDFWQGQTHQVDYVPQRCHLTFRYWYDYSGGTMTDWGAHHNDIARWAVGLDGPVSIEGAPTTQPIPDGYTAFSDYEVNYTYANGVRHTVKTTQDDSIYGSVVKENGQRNGLRFEGSNGWIWVNRDEIEASDDALLSAPLPASATRLYVSNDHMGNFFDCVRSRKLPVADVETGHRSASMCHLGVIAMRLGRKLNWDPAREKFTGEGAHDADKMLAREMRKPFDYHFA